MAEDRSADTTAVTSTFAKRAWIAFIFFGAVATVIYFLSPPAWSNVVQDAIGLAAVIAIFAGIRAQPNEASGAWLAMALGQFLFVAGDIIWTVYENVLGRESPFPSAADVAYLAGYIPLVIGLTLLVRTRDPGRDVTSLIDSALITVGAGCAAWVFLIAPQITANHDLVAQGVSAAYPLADLLMLGMVVRLMFSMRRRIPAYVMLCVSLIALIAADSGYLFGTLHGWYATRSPIDFGWLASYVLWGAAALHPSRSNLAKYDAPEVIPGRLTRPRLASLTVMALAAPAMLTIQGLRHRPLHLPVMVLAVAVVSLLVIARMGGLANALEAAAYHDSLTGLPNRRLLLDRLHLALARMERSRLPVAVLFIDLGRFKAVNDDLGHSVGDEVLAELGVRLKITVRTEDTVARFGGDEFVVICEGIGSEMATTIADRLRYALSRPINVRGDVVRLAVDVGIAIANPGCDDAEHVLSQADLAMYRAKEEAKEGLGESGSRAQPASTPAG